MNTSILGSTPFTTHCLPGTNIHVRVRTYLYARRPDMYDYVNARRHDIMYDIIYGSR